MRKCLGPKLRSIDNCGLMVFQWQKSCSKSTTVLHQVIGSLSSICCSFCFCFPSKSTQGITSTVSKQGVKCCFVDKNKHWGPKEFCIDKCGYRLISRCISSTTVLHQSGYTTINPSNLISISLSMFTPGWHNLWVGGERNMKQRIPINSITSILILKSMYASGSTGLFFADHYSHRYE